MVSTTPTYLVDTTFFLRRTADAFHDAPLLVADGRDHTFAYGFLRDLLRARRALGVTRGILVVGKEGHAVATDADVKAVVEYAKVLDLPVVHQTQRTGSYLTCIGYGRNSSINSISRKRSGAGKQYRLEIA